MNKDLVIETKDGLYVPRADIYIDPWRPVKRAVITHAHADHARSGMKSYYMTPESRPILEHRVRRAGQGQRFYEKDYGQEFGRNGVHFSFHPAGHVPGSAQVRVEYKGEVWVVTGDWKRQDDGLSKPFIPVKCDTFVTETTFGLPVYRWRAQEEIITDIYEWYRGNIEIGLCSIIGAYALGKAQRIIHGLSKYSDVKMFCHGAVFEANKRIREAGFPLIEVPRAGRDIDKSEYRDALIVSVPSAFGTPWMKKFRPFSLAFASGWMTARGTRRRKGGDRGFVMSDHADWDAIMWAVERTGAKRVITAHGYTAAVARYLEEVHGLETGEFTGHFARRDDED